ncbi:DUF7002 family protein [Paenibacillus sp. sgz500958]|uniref:DUF7002 family protein n=1 Tax=Paenibacillus sp. sgz500958 TaxID=3242475 RepID=UPI0036D2A061
MKDDIIAAVTKGRNRSVLYHFTRARNLQAISALNTLYSSVGIKTGSAGERRLKAETTVYRGYPVTINSHLRIADSMIDAGTTVEQFRACLDRHIFFWPTLKDCRKMMDTYGRREPEEHFAVLAMDASSLIYDHFDSVKLSKYDSGSSPRFPSRCSYRKSPEMLLPISLFQRSADSRVPAKSSDVKEILVEDQVNHVSAYLQAVYTPELSDVSEAWRNKTLPYTDLYEQKE